MTFFIFWIFLSILVGAYASSKKRSGVGWFFLSLIISPLIAFIIILVAGSPQGTLKKCPKCAEEVKAEAQVCRFCNYEFPINPGPVDQVEPTVPPIKAEDIDALWKRRKKVQEERRGF